MQQKKFYKPSVTIVGHPNAEIGMGAHIRSAQRAMLAARIDSYLFDVYNSYQDEETKPSEFSGQFVSRFNTNINLFCINGDEIEPILKHLKIEELSDLGGYNIIYPMWELPTYPQEWMKKLEQFDEIWAPSKFIEGALKSSISPKSLAKINHMSIACEVKSDLRRTRRSFGIPEDAFAFLTSFDFSSYMDRKNPFAVVDAFVNFKKNFREDRAVLVVKVHRGSTRPHDYREFLKTIKSNGDIVLIDESISGQEMISLISICDVYVSLHRAEGFGLGIAEAMCLGRPTICTGWSGNMDFCDELCSLTVDYKLISVKPGQYPYWQGQTWANADIYDAARKMDLIASDRKLYNQISFEGRVKAANNLTHLSVGLRYRNRIQEIMSSISGSTI